MIKGTGQSDQLDSDIESRLRVNREKQRVINTKYHDSNQQMARKDIEQLERLVTEENFPTTRPGRPPILRVA
ncbi:7810_t:CDS:2 [Racocetra fulgida]|uniref:7810_t:CDS:1 n=1 Tax=Racocetra fulgida TaxID=60492 RepID=A0A9N9HRI4_9GLOM|nr:7810_t:CDS:2 [Racocetra fulgida]